MTARETARRRIDLSGARILVTNDDGIHAPGLAALERIALSLSDDVWVVAPETEQSATSHSLTIRRPLRLRHLGPRRYSVDGTPTDCVVIAVTKALHEGGEGRAPDIVLSGINHGSNLGEDVTYSGTVAAAMEAAMLGIPSIAFSLMRHGDHEFRWDSVEHHAPALIRRLAEAGFAADMLVNVNFPDLPAEAVRGTRVCRQGRRGMEADVVEGRDPGGRPYLWIGDLFTKQPIDPESDLAAVADGYVAVTPLHLDLTYDSQLAALEEVFS